MRSEYVRMAFYVYLLHCSDGSYYVGHTDNLEQRLSAHQSALIPGYTSQRRPVILVWYETFPSRDEAFQRERQIKGWSRSKKEALARDDWAELRRLSRTHPSTSSG
jgi:predicted GIY-YIG superfamily endonuclease